MDSYSFEDGDDEFVVVSVHQPPHASHSSSPFHPASIESTEELQADEGGARRSRSRGRTDSGLRRQRQQQAEIEKAGSTVLLVSNLRDKCHEPFRARLAKEIPAGHLKGVHIAAEHPFGFLDFADLECMNAAMRRLADCEINGYPISLSRCAAVTPGRNPRAMDDEAPCDTLALKPLPQDLTMTMLRTELSKLPGVDPVEAYFHVSPSGTFSGTVILRFATLERAQHAHTFLNSITMLGRQLRAEYKRADTRAAPRMYLPPCRETEVLFARLKDFKSSAEQRLVLTTKLMANNVREQLIQMVAFLSLRAIADGETPRVQLTILRPLEDRAPSRASIATTTSAFSTASDRAPSASRTSSLSRPPSVIVSRTPRGPDGTKGFNPASFASATPRDSGLDGTRSAVLSHTLDARSSSGTWRRSTAYSRLTGTS